MSDPGVPPRAAAPPEREGALVEYTADSSTWLLGVRQARLTNSRAGRTERPGIAMDSAKDSGVRDPDVREPDKLRQLMLQRRWPC